LSSIAIVLIAWTFAGVAFSVGEGERAVKLASYGIIIVLGLFMLARHSKGCACASCSRRHEAADGGGMQWLLALGVGIIPCPGILVFLFYAMANGMLGSGIVLALVMALGIALALCALGVAGIFAHKKLVSSAKKSSNLPVILRTSTSVAITVIGVTLFVGALFD
ncbi:MAG: hypothetical protein LBO78_03125, partial [Rickettsiales bacterium]|nr:hypothetical protein [Rickettsiales bacterium]